MSIGAFVATCASCLIRSRLISSTERRSHAFSKCRVPRIYIFVSVSSLFAQVTISGVSNCPEIRSCARLLFEARGACESGSGSSSSSVGATSSSRPVPPEVGREIFDTLCWPEFRHFVRVNSRVPIAVSFGLFSPSQNASRYVRRASVVTDVRVRESRQEIFASSGVLKRTEQRRDERRRSSSRLGPVKFT